MIGLDPRDTHFYLSMVKSVLRIAGCMFAAFSGSVLVLAVTFAAAEVIGILEEIDFETEE